MFRISTLIVSLFIITTAQSAVYHIEIRDAEPGQPLTPPVAVVHQSGYSLFAEGAAATPGLEALAEDGMTGALVEEANNSSSVMTVVVGGSAPTFGSYKFLIEGEPGDLFSAASMFAKTNDNFIGVSGIALPSGGDPIIIDSQVYDAGTEVNTGLAAHIPAFGNVLIGEDENGVITTISQYSLVDDPALGQVDFTWPPAAQVIITPMPDAVDYRITITGLSEGQPLTPPLIAVHNDSASIFEVGGTASAGLELLAEEGATADLQNELIPVAGVWTVSIASDAPGFEHQTTIAAEPGQLISIVSMFARTNDNFIGVSNFVLPSRGSNETIESSAYDAGTETNTGLVEHIPFYGNAGGPDENSTISIINSFSVLDDPSGQLDYTWPPAASIQIEALAQQSSIADFELYQ